MCGTKSDLLDDDRSKRGIDFHDAQDYADGVCLPLLGAERKLVGAPRNFTLLGTLALGTPWASLAIRNMTMFS